MNALAMRRLGVATRSDRGRSSCARAAKTPQFICTCVQMNPFRRPTVGLMCWSGRASDQADRAQGRDSARTN